MRRLSVRPSAWLVRLLVPLACCLALTQALPYFRIEDGGRQCFLEEVPEDTLIVGKYKLLDWQLMNSGAPGRQMRIRTYRSANHTRPPSSPHCSLPLPYTSMRALSVEAPTVLSIEVRDPRQTAILSHVMTEQGQFGFTSSVSGEHSLCTLASPTPSYYGGAKTYRVQLVLDYGEEAIDYAVLAKSEHLSAIEVEVRKLNDKLRAIGKEQEYHKAREIAWRNHSENVNTDVMWWSIAQTVVLVAAGLMQLYLLTKFFKSKKLA